MEIRQIELEDAENFLELTHLIEEERVYKLFEKGEQIATVQEQEEQIRWFQSAPNRTILIAEDQGVLVGYAMLMGGEYAVDRATVVIVLEVRASHQRRGIGRTLLHEAEQWARSVGVHRVELTVLTDNDAAIPLYSSYGFVREGTKRAARLVKGTFKDEYLMAKILD